VDVEAEGATVALLRALDGCPRLRSRIATLRTPLLGLARLSKTNPRPLAPYGLSAPASWFGIHLAVFAGEAGDRCRPALPPSGLRPASESDPDTAHRRACSHEVLSPHSAT